MRSSKNLVFGAAAVLLAAIAVVAVLLGRNSAPMLLGAPKEVQTCAEDVMTAICAGDFSAAEERLYGQPDLGMDQMPEDPVNRAFWQAYLDSLDYELVGDVYATAAGAAQDVKIISMELTAATEHLSRRAKELLQDGMDHAEDASEIYDGSGYKESFVEDVMARAVTQALEEDVKYTYQVVPLQMKYSGGKWWVVADQKLLNAISGGTAG